MASAAIPSGGGQRAESRPFQDILGYDGILKTETSGSGWRIRTYYAVQEGRRVPIAESFGYEEAQDHSVDLDGDGRKELAVNVQYGGDGHETVFVYRRRGDGVQRGRLELKGKLPGHDDWGANSVSGRYDPETGTFRVRYALKNTQELGTAEFSGLGDFAFAPFPSSGGGQKPAEKRRDPLHPDGFADIMTPF